MRLNTVINSLISFKKSIIKQNTIRTIKSKKISQIYRNYNNNLSSKLFRNLFSAHYYQNSLKKVKITNISNSYRFKEYNFKFSYYISYKILNMRYVNPSNLLKENYKIPKRK